MALTEPPNLDNLHMLNSHMSARIDDCHFCHLENVWHIDSGANNHITGDQANFSDHHLSSSKQIIWTGGGSVKVKGYGSVLIDWIRQNGERVPVVLTNVLHVPGINTHLISLRRLDLKGIYCRLDDQTLCVIKIYKEVGAWRIVCDLYVIVTDLQNDAFLFGTHVASAVVAVSQPIESLHNCLGYYNLEDICRLVNMAKWIEIRNQNIPNVCNGCAQGKYTIDINHQVASRAELAYDLLYLVLL